MAGVPTDRTRVRRMPKRGAYDRETIRTILDEAFLCHLGFIADGHPVVVPTLYGRQDDTVFLHGSGASRAKKGASGDGLDVCIEVTLMDGLVLARSAVNHSVNYRSVVVYGRAVEITDPDEKCAALRVLSEHVVTGRWRDVRGPTAKELKGTSVLALSLVEASAKVRAGQPEDDEDDYDSSTWAGVIPFETVAGDPIADPRLGPGANDVPDYASRYARPGARDGA